MLRSSRQWIVALISLLSASSFFDAAHGQSPVDLSQPLASELYFDFGTPSSDRAPGFEFVAAERSFEADGRFGWEGTPRTPFDDGEAFRLAWASRAVLSSKPEPIAAFIDGVSASEELHFLADVPRPAPYWVYVTVGRIGAPAASLEVALDDRVIAKDIVAFGTDCGPAACSPTATVKGMVEASGGSIKVTVRGKSPSISCVRMRPVEIRPSLFSLGENSALRRAISLEEELAELAMRDPQEEVRAFDRLVELYRSALEDEVDEESSYLYVIRDRYESARRLRDAKRWVSPLAFSADDKSAGQGPYERIGAAYDLCSGLVEGDVLWPQAQLLQARVAYWIGGQKSNRHLAQLRRTNPKAEAVAWYESKPETSEVDVALDPLQMTLGTPKLGQTTKVRVPVWSLGTQITKDVVLEFRATGERIRRIKVPSIDGAKGAPLPSTIVEFLWTPRSAGRKRVRIALSSPRGASFAKGIWETDVEVARE